MQMPMYGGAPQIWSEGVPVNWSVFRCAWPYIPEILRSLERAYDALAAQCAVASLGYVIPAMRELPGFEKVHEENYEVSYHLTTAIGSARQILMGYPEPGYFALIVSCIHEACKHQQMAMEALERMAEAAPEEIRPLIQRLRGLMQATSGHLQRARGLVRAAYGPEAMRQLRQRIEEAHHG